VKIRVRLKAGREKQMLRGSAWVFSGAIEEVDGTGSAGETADVFDTEGDWLGRGLWHPEADMTVRLLHAGSAEALDEAFFRARVRQAVGLRHRLFGRPTAWDATNAWRMVFSEADGLSGLIADQFADRDAAGGRQGLGALDSGRGDELKAATGAGRVCVRADGEAVKREGLAEALGGDPAPETVVIRENGFTFEAGLAGGQKTGFYLDQRENRRKVAAYARGARC
jgi:23S rRNA (cytosine1962-C5)-methyltransferase